MSDDNESFVSAVAVKHGKHLQRFLTSRLRNAADVSDFEQEVYMRLLRVDRHELIRSPEAYVMTIASHLIGQRALKESVEPVSVEFTKLAAELTTTPEEEPLDLADQQRRVRELLHVLKRVSPRAQATLILHCRDGWSLAEIAERFGVSRNMVKKYLAQALAYCRRRLRAE